MKQHTVIDSPYGPLTLVAEDGVLCGLYMTDQRHRPPEETFGTRDDTFFAEAEEQLKAYFAGELKEFTVELRLTRHPVPAHASGSSCAASRTARPAPTANSPTALGNPAASRAVGLANGRNPIGIIVPCHRVIGANGSLTGYGGGLDRKQRLLDFENGARALPADRTPP